MTVTADPMSTDASLSPFEAIVGDPTSIGNQRAVVALDDLVNQIRETYRIRQDLLHTEGDLQRRILAMWRRAGVSKAPKSTPEEKRCFAEAVWLERMLLWKEAKAIAEASGKKFTRKPPDRPSVIAPGGGDLTKDDFQVPLVSPIPHGQDSAGGQQMYADPHQVALRASGPLDSVDVMAQIADVDETVAFAVSVTWMLIQTREQIHKHRMAQYEKSLIAFAKQLPVYPWAEATRGFAAISLAQLVGEAGNLSNYDNPAKLWKRMGLAVMPDGQRQRRVTGEDAIEHGYNPSRRAVSWVVGDNLIRATNETYYGLFLERRDYERAMNLEAQPIVHMRRAHRYMEKRFLKDLWRAWRDADRTADN